MVDDLNISVLVVDDETSVCKSLTGFLEDYDFEVVSCPSAEQALEQWDEQVCDVAIVDMRLPGMDGDALIMKLHDRSPGTRFLIYTGSVDYCLSSALEDIGVRHNHVLHKPLPDLSIIVDRLHDLLSSEEHV